MGREGRYGAFGRTMAQPTRNSGWRPFTIHSNTRGTSGTRPGNRSAISAGGVPDVSEARQITTDHSGATPSSITRFAGDRRGVQPDVFVETLQPGDRLVLCSDGLTRHVTDAEISVAVADPAAKAADALVALARSRGGQDNITVVVYRAGRPAVSRALLGTLILALLILVGIAGALGALVTTPIPSPSVGPVPTVAP